MSQFLCFLNGRLPSVVPGSGVKSDSETIRWGGASFKKTGWQDGGRHGGGNAERAY